MIALIFAIGWLWFFGAVVITEVVEHSGRPTTRLTVALLWLGWPMLVAFTWLAAKADRFRKRGTP